MGNFIMPSGYRGSRQILKCHFCEKMFYPKGGQLKTKYCSRDCKHKDQKGKPTKYIPRQHPLPKMTITICKGCGKEFEHRASAKLQYCECWFYRTPKIPHTCAFCGAEFMEYKSADRKYCNSECYWKNLKIIGRGENSNFWKGGTTSESKSFRSSVDYKKWRIMVYERDNYTCVECGYKPTDKGCLHAHHIESFAENINLRTDINNGITLCFNCHQKKHKHKLILPVDYYNASILRFRNYKLQYAIQYPDE
jgi:hypothetical protein